MTCYDSVTVTVGRADNLDLEDAEIEVKIIGVVGDPSAKCRLKPALQCTYMATVPVSWYVRSSLAFPNARFDIHWDVGNAPGVVRFQVFAVGGGILGEVAVNPPKSGRDPCGAGCIATKLDLRIVQ